MSIRSLTVVVSFAGTMMAVCHAQDGSLDSSFNPNDSGFGIGDGINNPSSVKALGIQADGRVILGGIFTSYNAQRRVNILRVMPDGSLDETFSPNLGTGGIPLDVLVLSDGKIMVSGIFTQVNGSSYNRIVRLNPDGMVDATFSPGTGANGGISSMALQPDGKIVIGGGFSSYGGVSRRGIARIHQNGAIDESFDPGSGVTVSGSNGTVHSIAILPNGKIAVGGTFTHYDGVPMRGIARIFSDGSLDEGFVSGVSELGGINSIGIGLDGKMIIGGLFDAYMGVPSNGLAKVENDGSMDLSFSFDAGSSVDDVEVLADGKVLVAGVTHGYSQGFIARLNADGSMDNSFEGVMGMDGYVNTIRLLPNGNVYAAGSFRTYNGRGAQGICRLTANGGIDSGFNPGNGASNPIACLTLQSDGKIVIGGGFTSFNGVARRHTARLNSDGSLDPSFDPGIGLGSGEVLCTVVMTDGKIIIGGSFLSMNSIPQNRIARLNSNGSLDETFNAGQGANGTVRSIVLLPDGKLLICGDFTNYDGQPRRYLARLHADGALDTSFNPGQGPDDGLTIVKVQDDGRALIGGGFSSYNGVSRLRVARINTDGTLDMSFNPGTGANNTVFDIAVQNDGKVVVVGWFSTFNGTSRRGIARLNSDGSMDGSFNPGSGVALFGISSVVVQPDGKIIVAGRFNSYNGVEMNGIARIQQSGALDQSFQIGTGIGVGTGYVYEIVSDIALQSDGQILIVGEFISYNGIGRNRLARINNVVVGVDYHEESSIGLFPNPTQGIVTFELSDPARVAVYDILGRPIVPEQFLSRGVHSINLSGQANGQYCIHTSSSNQISRRMFIVQQ